MLPILPQLTDDDKTNIALLYAYLQQVSLSFANAAGFAIDPSMGEGGDDSLTITEAPTGITYTPTSSTGIDSTLFGAIDITFVKPDRAVGIIIYYREVGIDNFKQSFAFSSPFRLINLKVGGQYQLQLAGQAANGNISSVLSPLVTVTIPFAIILTLGSQVIETEPEYIEPFIIPGPRGLQGLQGLQGIPGIDADEPAEPFIMQGLQSIQGLQGLQGTVGIPGLDADESSSPEPVTLLRDLPTIGRIVTVLDNLGVFAATTSAQLAAVISDETGTGVLVFGTGPTLVSPVIANIAPTANFTLTQNTVVPFTSEGTGAVADTLRLKQGSVSVGAPPGGPSQLLHVYAPGGASTFVRIDSSSGGGQAGVIIVAGNGATSRASRIDFLNIPASTTVPRWTILNDYNQDGTNDLVFINATGSEKLITLLQNGNVGFGIATPNDTVEVNGYLRLSRLTLKLITSGASPVLGEATLVAGTKAVLSDAVTANSRVFLTRKTSGGTLGTAITYTLQTSAPKGFTITSDSALDTSTFTWGIFEGF